LRRFEHQPLQEAPHHRASAGEVEYVTIGKKAVQAINRLRRTLLADFPIKDPAKFAEVRSRGPLPPGKVPRRATTRRCSSPSTTSSTPSPSSDRRAVAARQSGDTWRQARLRGPGDRDRDRHATEYTFEPSAASSLTTVLPQYVNDTVYQMVLESRASEHSSRMVAMKNATDNAKQMIKDLSLEYNKLRQAAITNELLEITTAKMALE
jgi:F-type H+-transporting ATPase subunit gamma